MNILVCIKHCKKKKEKKNVSAVPLSLPLKCLEDGGGWSREEELFIWRSKAPAGQFAIERRKDHAYCVPSAVH